MGRNIYSYFFSTRLVSGSPLVLLFFFFSKNATMPKKALAPLPKIKAPRRTKRGQGGGSVRGILRDLPPFDPVERQRCFEAAWTQQRQRAEKLKTQKLAPIFQKQTQATAHKNVDPILSSEDSE